LLDNQSIVNHSVVQSINQSIRMLSKLLFTFAALMLSQVRSETIVSDNLGNVVGLPLAGGNATADITNQNSRVSTSPYVLSVFVNNGENTNMPHIPGTRESYWFHPPNNAPLYGNATLVRTAYSGTFSTTDLSYNTTANQYLGSANNPIITTGLYQFTFTIPVLQSIFVQLTYINSGAPQPVVDLISILVDNPAVVVGDPQFVGLRGQSFQVHGIDGAVYNIVSDSNLQVNARFVFLSEGKCPTVNGKVEPNCWSHPGSYLGEMSFQQVVDGKLHQALVSAGSAMNGFDSVSVDGEELEVGQSVKFGSFEIELKSTHHVTIQTEQFLFELSNSDQFINQAVTPLVSLSKLTCHGLLGQTHKAKVYNSAARYIEGEVDDYVISDSDLFGTQFNYNKFQHQ